MSTTNSVAEPRSDTPPNTAPSKIGVRRACDCCRRRKVRCDGQSPCRPCTKAQLRCAYLQPPKKKGPKGLRSARVLHALRDVDDSTPSSPTTPTGPFQPEPFGQWGWSSNDHSFASSIAVASLETGYDPTMQAMDTNLGVSSPETAAFYQMATSPTLIGSFPELNAGNLLATQAYPSRQTESCAYSDTTSDACVRLPPAFFIPYMTLFFDHLYPIMPVLDREKYLNTGILTGHSCLMYEEYALLCALCAATIVQLDTATLLADPDTLDYEATADLFINECLRERQHSDYVENPSAMTVMTSFFLFAFYGNLERKEKAWYYLQESISFAQVIGLDDENVIAQLEDMQKEWWRRLYWLLFVTERAYSIQRRRHARLKTSVGLPQAANSDDPSLLYGFVNLVTLFSAVDDDFVSTWRGKKRGSLVAGPWLADTQKALDISGYALGPITETQHLDISVSRQWLHVLAWQVGVDQGLLWQDGALRWDRPVEIAKEVVRITSTANRFALESHGIGMEQKLSDIASCLTDVLKCAAPTCSAFSQGRQYLCDLMQQLVLIRGKESRYFQPLLAHAGHLVGYQTPRRLRSPDYGHETFQFQPRITEATEADDAELLERVMSNEQSG